MKYLGKKTDNLDIATKGDIPMGSLAWLNKLEYDSTELIHRPKINNVTLIGSQTSHDLALQAELATPLTEDLYLVDGTAPTLEVNKRYYTGNYKIYVNGNEAYAFTNSMFIFDYDGENHYYFTKFYGGGYPAAVINYDSTDTQEYTYTYSNYVKQVDITTTMPNDVNNSIWDRKVPSTKLFKAQLDLKQNTLTAGTNISISGNTISATDTTYSAFTGTDGTSAGTAGLVPAPAITDAGKFLKADGTWAAAGGGSSDLEAANRKRVDRYNVPKYYTSRVRTGNIIPTEWETVTAYSEYVDAFETIRIYGLSNDTATSNISNAFDGNSSTYVNNRRGINSRVIDFSDGPVEITKIKVKADFAFDYNDFFVYGSNDNFATYDLLLTVSGSGNVSVDTEYTLDSHGLYRYYSFCTTNGGDVMYEFAVSEFIQHGKYLTIDDGGSTAYEDKELLYIQTPGGISTTGGYQINKNGLGYKIISGTLKPVTKYILIGNQINANRFQYDILAEEGMTSFIQNTLNTKANTSSLGSLASMSSIDYTSNYITNKPTIPTVNDATITITQGGVTKGTFTTNQSSAVSIDLDAGGGSNTNPYYDLATKYNSPSFLLGDSAPIIGNIFPTTWTTLGTDTEYSSNGFVIEADSVYSSNQRPSNAFDGATNTYWRPNNNTTNATMTITLPIEMNITKMNVSILGNSITSWAIEGSNDNSDWVQLYTTTDKSGSSSSFIEATLNNTNFYKYYRINITKNGSAVNLYEVQTVEYKIKNNIFTLNNSIDSYIKNMRVLLTNEINDNIMAFSTDIVPYMTADIGEGFIQNFVISASSSNYPAYHAVNKSKAAGASSSAWCPSDLSSRIDPAWWQIDLPFAVNPTNIYIKYYVMLSTSYMQGQRIDGTWETIAENIGSTSTAREEKNITIQSNNYYKAFKIYIPGYYSASYKAPYLFEFAITSGYKTIYDNRNTCYININNLGEKAIDNIEFNNYYETVYNGTSFNVLKEKEV